MASPLITDPLDWRRDPVTGDLVVPIQYVAGLEGVAQLIRQGLLLTRGEWFLDRGAGMPWVANDFVSDREAILGGAYRPEYTRAQVRKIILATRGVDSIASLDVAFDGPTRTMTVTGEVRTIWGAPLAIQEEFKL